MLRNRNFHNVDFNVSTFDVGRSNKFRNINSVARVEQKMFHFNKLPAITFLFFVSLTYLCRELHSFVFFFLFAISPIIFLKRKYQRSNQTGFMSVFVGSTFCRDPGHHRS